MLEPSDVRGKKAMNTYMVKQRILTDSQSFDQRNLDINYLQNVNRAVAVYQGLNYDIMPHYLKPQDYFKRKPLNYT
jgi:hypothetical protein